MPVYPLWEEQKVHWSRVFVGEKKAGERELLMIQKVLGKINDKQLVVFLEAKRILLPN